MPKVTVTFRTEESNVKQLDEIARASKRDRSQLIIEALDNYLEVQEWQLSEIKAAIREADAGDFASDAEVEAIFDRQPR
jgi:predicted transcriptional regulator